MWPRPRTQPSLEVGEGPEEVAGALVAAGVLVQVLLVVVLGVPPAARGQDLGDDAALPPLVVDGGRDLAGHALLLGRVGEDAGPVLRAHVGPLAVGRGRVVHAVEEL